MKNKAIIILLAGSVVTMAGKLPGEPEIGKEIYKNKCSVCHGKDGTKGLFGAKNLQKSKLTDIEYFNIIYNGKSVMPTWKPKLTTDQINQVIDYIKELRK